LETLTEEGQAMVQDEWIEGVTTEEEGDELLRKAHLSSNGQVSLLEFAMNPYSFGQSVENLFYISFLIREGSVAIGHDKHGLATLGMCGFS
jgi:non-structural maintenance of chromosomes element 4